MIRCRACGAAVCAEESVVGERVLLPEAPRRLASPPYGTEVLEVLAADAALGRLEQRTGRHPWWRCCRLIAAQISCSDLCLDAAVVVYKDAVVGADGAPLADPAHPDLPAVSLAELRAAVAAAADADRLLLVKLGAPWCPFSRISDLVLAQMRLPPGVELLTVNTDTDPLDGTDLVTGVVPSFAAYYRGSRVQLAGGKAVKGGLLTGVQRREDLEDLAEEVLERAQEGRRRVYVS